MTIHCEKSSFDKIKNWLVEEKFKFGLVIGQSLKECDYIIHVAELATLGCTNKGETEDQRPTSLNDVKCQHISSHVGQVIRMLPGGLDVQGVFVVCHNTDLSSALNEAVICTFMKTIYDATSRYYASTDRCPSRKLLLHACKKGDKIGVKTFSVTDANDGFTSRDIKPGRINWLQINYKCSVERTSYLREGSDAQSLVKDDKALLEPVTSILSDGLILFDNQLYNDSDCLHGKLTDKRSGDSSLSITAQFLDNGKVFSEKASIEESPGCIYTSGCVSGRVYLHNQATVLEAKTALKTDLVRSLVSRWQMHCDSLIEEPPEPASGQVVHEPPRRVFLEGGGLPVSLCDYLFPGDTVADACQSAFEILGISVSEDGVDDSVETFSDPQQLLASRDSNEDEQATTVMSSIETVKRSNLLQIFIAILVCLIATAASYIFFTREKVVK